MNALEVGAGPFWVIRGSWRAPRPCPLPSIADINHGGGHVSFVPHPDSCSAASFGQIVDPVSGLGGMERSGWRCRLRLKRHVGHPGPKPVQVYRVQSW
jgi:hypothetical protein